MRAAVCPGRDRLATRRIEALRALGLPYPAPEPAFHDLARLASLLCGAPIVLIALADDSHNHPLALVGLPATAVISLDAGFLSLLQLTEDFVLVEDCEADDVFAHVRWTRAPHAVRMLAAAPLFGLDDDVTIGYVCVMDRITRQLSPDQQEGLKRIARQVRTLLDWRRRLHYAKQTAEASCEREAALQNRLPSLEMRVEQLAAEAFSDHLTGIANRRRFDQQLARQLTDRRSPLLLGVVDLDGFKTYNDTHGHEAGDRLLMQIAQSMQAVVGDSALLARIGGDEFGLLLQGTIDDWWTELHRLLDAVTSISGGDGVSASIGIATAVNEDTASSLYVRADEALYVSKRRGGNQLEVSAKDSARKADRMAEEVHDMQPT